MKELHAAYLTLRTFCNEERQVHIRLKLDNTTSVRYINKKGGRKKDLNEIARRIWLWAKEREIWLSAEHLPGVFNVQSDMTSRKQYAFEMEWRLDTTIFQCIDRQFGPFQVDLFATRLNAQCQKYFSWKPDPHAFAIDAFTQCWSHELMYGFPPFSLILKTLKKVEQDGAMGLFIFPHWTTAMWLPMMMRLKIGNLIILPPARNILRLPGTDKIHPMKSLRLLAVILKSR